MLNITVIYGAAGTGKTQMLSEKINYVEKLNKSIIILAPTHSSLNNLKKRVKELNTNISDDKFQTIYSYFRIDYENENVLGPKNTSKNIFIDEFSLIKKEIFLKILSKLGAIKTDINLILSGDILQLPPIYTNKRYISLNKLHKHYENINSHVVEHDYNTIFSLKEIRNSTKICLTKNYRSNSFVLNTIDEIFYKNNCDIFKNNLTLSEVVKLIINDNYVFISSKYSHHEPVYNLFKTQIRESFKFNDLIFYDDAKFIVKETFKDFKNGDLLKFHHEQNGEIYMEKEDGEIFVYDKKIQITPNFLLTAHKSQGLSIDKVIICLDDLFKFSMLYTMCTRARTDIKFFHYKDIDLKNYLEHFNLLRKFYIK